MADQVTLTIDGKEVKAAPGMLVIDAAKHAGIEIPAFCYYEGYSLQAACRMCLVEIEKFPKMQAACTIPVAEGMVVRTETAQVAAVRKSTLEFLLANHPLDCPVCDKGGECELQDMVFRYGAGESRFVETKLHVDEKQWSPVVFYDAPRCILCFRCIRVCDEGLGVGALGLINRGVYSEIAPSHGDHLECDECGMCIDICPVGALTSGTYRYKTRPWEMDHVGTICTHCSNGCKTTLGVRNNEIVRGNNRDSSGVNGEFLCIKGRYGFDFYDHPDRLQSPLMKVAGKLEPVSWGQALGAVAAKFAEVKSRGGKFGIAASARTTNEENYYLQKFARQGLGTNNIDHRRSGDVVTLLNALSGVEGGGLATTDDVYNAKAVLIVGADLSQEQPFLAFQIRANFRHHQAQVFIATSKPVREDDIAAKSVRCAQGGELEAVASLAEQLGGQKDLVVVFDDSIKGAGVERLVEFVSALGIPAKYVPLVDYSNSRGALDMGLVPELLPGYKPNPDPGLTLGEMIADPALDVFWSIGSNPLAGATLASKSAFIVAQDLFLTETSRQADVVLPACSAYEKNGTVTNVTGQVQRLKRAVQAMGTKPDLEIIGLIAKEMGLAPLMGPWTVDKVLDEIRKTVHGYDVPMPVLIAGAAVPTQPVNGKINAPARAELIHSAHDGLFKSGTLGRYSKMLNSVLEAKR